LRLDSCLLCSSWLDEWIGSHFDFIPKHAVASSDHKASCSPVCHSPLAAAPPSIQRCRSQRACQPSAASLTKRAIAPFIQTLRRPWPDSGAQRPQDASATWCSPTCLACGSQWASADVGTRRGPPNSGILDRGNVARRRASADTGDQLRNYSRSVKSLRVQR
jgi:hypothetical protein